MAKMMKLSDLHVTVGLQPRGDELDKHTVAEYASRAKAGDKFPPLLAFKVTDRKFKGPALVAGFHRKAAYESADITEAEVDLREGTFNEAWLAGYLSNHANGNRYSNVQKRHAVKTALLLFRKDSATSLSEKLKVSVQFVIKVKDELVAVGELEEQKTIVGKDGREQPAKRKPLSTVESGPEKPLSKSQIVDDEEPESETEPVNQERVEQDDKPTDVQVAPEPETPSAIKVIESVCRGIDQLNRQLDEIKKEPLAYPVHFHSVQSALKNARETLWASRAVFPDPYCKGTGKKNGDACKACRGTGMVIKSVNTQAVRAVGPVEDAA